MEVTRNRVRKTLELKQASYIDNINKKLCISCTTKDFTVPVRQAGIDHFHKLTAGDVATCLGLGDKSILELLGSLLWATATHPEIS